MKTFLIVSTAVLTGVVAVRAVPGAQPTVSAAPQQCLPQKAHTPVAGHTENIEGKVRSGKTLLLSDDSELLTNSTLCTGDNGKVRFVVDDPSTTCEMDPRSRIRIKPPKLVQSHLQVIIRWEAGFTWCATGEDPNGSKKKKYDGREGRVRLLMNDPLFFVGVNNSRTLVKVALGYTEVSRRAGGGAVIVGPAQQVTVPEGGEPGSVEPIDRTANDDDHFASLQPVVPPADYSRPDAGGSEAMQRIFSRKLLVVGIGSDLSADQGTEPFVRGYFSFLAKNWNLSVRFLNLQTASVGNALDGHKIDLGVVRKTTRLRGFGTFPLFADMKGAVWRVALVDDAEFSSALYGFLRATVNANVYGRMYRASFEKEPSYDALRPVLFG
jgi:hypothetical protein